MRFLRRELVALLATLLLLAGAALAGPRYFCQMSGKAQDVCCCRHEVRANDCRSGIEASDCCQRIKRQEQAQLNRVLSPGELVQPAALAAVLPVPVEARSSFVRAATIAERGRGPPLTGPPIFVTHCALLI